MKVLVAIPCYDRTISCETARCLLDEQSIAASVGVEFRVLFAPGNSLITHARNQIVRDFMVSDADRLFFLDADVAWQIGDLLRLAMRPEPFVGGAYRFKKDEEAYPVQFVGKPANPVTGFIEMALLPGGFMSLSRDVFALLFREYPGRDYGLEGQTFNSFFHIPTDGAGEDGAFCRDYRNAGGTVWLDPTLTLTHVDAAGRKYTGCILDWLKRHAAPESIRDLEGFR